jgi:hypothetical protein
MSRMAKDRGDTKAHAKRDDVMVSRRSSRHPRVDESQAIEFERAFADALRDILMHERQRAA